MKYNTVHLLLFVDVDSSAGTSVPKLNAVAERQKYKELSQLIP